MTANTVLLYLMVGVMGMVCVENIYISKIGPAAGIQQASSVTIAHRGTTTKLSLKQVRYAYARVKKGGTVRWHIVNSPGGRYSNGMGIVNFVIYQKRTRNIRTEFYVVGYCNSMCAYWTSFADSLYTSDRTDFVFHLLQNCRVSGCKPYTSGPYYHMFMQRWGPYVKSILTKREYQQFKRGADVSISGKRMKMRIAS